MRRRFWKTRDDYADAPSGATLSQQPGEDFRNILNAICLDVEFADYPITFRGEFTNRRRIRRDFVGKVLNPSELLQL
jgi:hypothetical protein